MIFGEESRGRESAAWLRAGAWLACIYLTIPLARLLQEFLSARGGRGLFLWITYLGFAAAAGGLVRAAVRRRWRPSPRQLLVLAAIGGLFCWMTWSLRANPEEAFHFIQYGVLSLLLFRALRHRLQDPSIYLAAALLGAAAGIVDELIQWLVPQRYFDYRDIGINALAVGLVQLALAAGVRPAGVQGRPSRAGIRLAARAALLVVALLLFCVSNTPALMEWYSRHVPVADILDQATTEYGHRIVDPDIGVFYSRLPADELRRRDREEGAAAAARISPVRSDPHYAQFLKQIPAHRDPLAVEARIHLFRRDRHAAMAVRRPPPPDPAHYALVACRENQILAAYFSNTLHRSGFLWPEERAQRLAAMCPADRPYESAVSSQLITRISQAQVTAALLLLGLAALAVERWSACRRKP